MMICCLCEQRPGICGSIPLPLCLACRTKSYERVAAAEANPEPIILSLSPSPYEILAGQYQMRMTGGDGAPVI
jgi:hypothetical protein